MLQGEMTVYLFCPAVGRRQPATGSHIGVCPTDGRKACRFKTTSLGDSPPPCHNPFQGRLVKVAITPGIPYVLNFEQWSTQRLIGFAVDLVGLLGKYLRCVAKVVPAKASQYVAKNRTFTEGHFKQVSATSFDLIWHAKKIS